DNAQGSAATMQTQADADINAGARVLLIDPLDPGSGAAIESKAESQGVKVIDYDRLVSGGPADRYYVSFNNVQVGQLIGKGEVDCISAWKVTNPNILIMDGDPTDNNAKLFAQGYNGVLAPHFSDGSYTKVGEPPGTWTPSVAQTTFEQQYTAHPNINAVVTPNDDNANAVISVLQKNSIPANTFPTTGQDASTAGLQNILKGYQCGTVYKPVYAEAQAAAALALYLRAGPTSGKRTRPDPRSSRTSRGGSHGKRDHRRRVGTAAGPADPKPGATPPAPRDQQELRPGAGARRRRPRRSVRTGHRARRRQRRREVGPDQMHRRDPRPGERSDLVGGESCSHQDAARSRRSRDRDRVPRPGPLRQPRHRSEHVPRSGALTFGAGRGRHGDLCARHPRAAEGHNRPFDPPTRCLAVGRSAAVGRDRV